MICDDARELAQADADRRLVDAMRAKAPRARTAAGRGPAHRGHPRRAGDPKRARLERFVLLLGVLVSRGQEIEDDEAAIVRGALLG